MIQQISFNNETLTMLEIIINTLGQKGKQNFFLLISLLKETLVWIINIDTPLREITGISGLITSNDREVQF